MAVRKPNPIRTSVGDVERHAAEKALSIAKRQVEKGQRLCDKGSNLIAISQELRVKSTVCPVCQSRVITPIKRLKPLPKPHGKVKALAAVAGYRCSKGHIFFVQPQRKQAP